MRVLSRLPLSLGLSPVLAALALTAAGAQTESRTLTGDRVAIYNIAGKLRVQADRVERRRPDQPRRARCE